MNGGWDGAVVLARYPWDDKPLAQRIIGEGKFGPVNKPRGNLCFNKRESVRSGTGSESGRDYEAVD